MHALGVTGIVDRVEAVTRPYAGADAILRPCGHLGDQVGVRYLGPGHADQVEQALPYGVSCRGGVGDASGVHHGDIEPALDLGGEVQERRRGRPHGRDRLRQGSVALDGAPDGADEVDAVVDVQAGRRQRLLEGESAGSVLLQRHADADDEVRPDRGADRANHAAGDSSSVRQASPEVVPPLVRRRRQKAVQEVPVRLDLHAVESAVLAAGRRVGVVPHDAVQVPRLGLLGEGAVGGFAER